MGVQLQKAPMFLYATGHPTMQLGDKWYYLKPNGAMACNELLVIEKEPFYFMSDGHMGRTNARVV